MIKQEASDSQARRAAEKIGLAARKSRARESLDNFGGYMLIEPRQNFVVNGSRFDMSADDVVAFCKGRTK